MDEDKSAQKIMNKVVDQLATRINNSQNQIGGKTAESEDDAPQMVITEIDRDQRQNGVVELEDLTVIMNDLHNEQSSKSNPRHQDPINSSQFALVQQSVEIAKDNNGQPDNNNQNIIGIELLDQSVEIKSDYLQEAENGEAIPRVQQPLQISKSNFADDVQDNTIAQAQNNIELVSRASNCKLILETEEPQCLSLGIEASNKAQKDDVSSNYESQFCHLESQRHCNTKGSERQFNLGGPDFGLLIDQAKEKTAQASFYVATKTKELHENTSKFKAEWAEKNAELDAKRRQEFAEFKENTYKGIQKTKEGATKLAQETGAKLEEIAEKSKEALAKAKLQFVGPQEDAQRYQVDNEYIKHGYRINHHTCCRSFCSLFTCHNESVNVWSHLMGAIAFFTCFIVLICYVVPYQFVYGQKLVYDFNLIRTNSPNKADFVSFLDKHTIYFESGIQEIADINLTAYAKASVQTKRHYFWQRSNLTEEQQQEIDQAKKAYEDAVQLYDDGLIQSFSEAEGVTFFALSNFYDFKWVIDKLERQWKANKNNVLSTTQVNGSGKKYQEQVFRVNWTESIQYWDTTIQNFCNRIVIAQKHLEDVISAQKDISPMDTYQLNRLNFLQTRLQEYQVEIRQISNLMLINLKQGTNATDLNALMHETAPGFKDADYILSNVESWPLIVNLFSAMFCLGASAMYHLFYVQSENTSTFMARLDYGGIAILIFGTICTVIQYSFSCDEVSTHRLVFMFIMLFLCLVCFMTTLLPNCDKPQCRCAKGTMFSLLGLSTIVVFAYVDVSDSEYQIPIDTTWWGVGGAIYILGSTLFVTRFPERCKPGAFDYCGASHQIFHICVLFGCGIHYCMNLLLFYQRESFGCPLQQATTSFRVPISTN